MEFLNSAIGRLKEFTDLESAVRSGNLPAAVTGVTGIHKANIIYSLCSRLGRRAFVVTSDEPEANRLCADLTAMGLTRCFTPTAIFRCATRRAVPTNTSTSACTRWLRMLERRLRRGRLLRRRGAAVHHPARGTETAHRHAESGHGRSDGAGARRPFRLRLRAGGADRRAGAVLPPRRHSRLFPAGDAVAGARRIFRRRDRHALAVRPRDAAPHRTGRKRDRLPRRGSRSSPTRAALRSRFARSPRVSAARRRRKGENRAGARSRKAGEPACHSATPTNFCPILYGGKTACLLDYLGDDTLLFVSEPVKARERMRSVLWQWGEDLKDCLADGSLCRTLDTYSRDWADALRAFEKHGAVYLDAFVHGGYDTPVRTLLNMTARQLSAWGGSMQLLTEDLRNMLENKWACAVLAGNEKAAKTVAADLQAQGIDAAYVENPKKIERGEVVVTARRALRRTRIPRRVFRPHHPRARLRPQKQKAQKRAKAGQEITDISDLAPGDYIVHATHGIGVFEGIHKIEMQGVVKDYIKVQYAKGDTLYVPVTQLDMVSKYIGPREDAAVRLNRLGGADWQKAKARVRSAVKDIAKDLIKLYAQRMKAKGHAFPAGQRVAARL